MAERGFPRANLNASAAPWGRRVESLLQGALTRLDQLDGSLDGTQVAAVRALRRLGADPDIYRQTGIVALADTEFAIFAGQDRGDGDGATAEGAFSSLNALPDKAALRHTTEDGGTAYVYATQSYVVNETQDGYRSVGSVTIGLGPGQRFDTFAGGIRGFELIEDERGMPQVTLAAREAPLLTLGYEAPVNGAQRPYMQWANDTEHRIYGFSDLAGAVPAGSETEPGRVQFATDTETVAGSIATKATTPRGVKKAITAALQGYSQKTPLDYFRGDWVQP